MKDNDIKGIMDGCDNLKNSNNDKVYWIHWEGKNIVYDIIKTQKIPDKHNLEKFKKDIQHLVGGAKFVRNYIYDRLMNEFEGNDYVQKLLTQFVDRLYDKIK